MRALQPILVSIALTTLIATTGYVVDRVHAIDTRLVRVEQLLNDHIDATAAASRGRARTALRP
jgi:hypothetical protein